MNLDLSTQADVTAEALGRQAAASHRHPGHQLDAAASAERGLIDQIDELARVAPGARVAATVILVGGTLRPIPIEPDAITAAGEPLADLQAVLDHYWQRPGDGVGLLGGPDGGGGYLFGLRSTEDGWASWLRANAADVVEFVDPDTDHRESRTSYREVGRCSTVRWHPSTPARQLTVVAFGRLEMDRATAALQHRPAGPALVAWNTLRIWRVPPPQASELDVKSRRLDAVDLLGGGEVLPLWVKRGDWQLEFDRMPMTEPAEPWFLTAVGATTRKVKP